MARDERVGFTGTRGGSMLMLPRIRAIVEALPEGTRVITGGCIGVDAAVARVAHARGLHVHTVLPADRSRVDPRWADYCDTHEEMPAGTDYRARNTRIVELSDRIVAIPEAGEHEPQSRRSGTWMTVRIARGAGKPVQEEVLTMTPDTTPYRPSPAATTCADCSGLLDGQRWRCAACQRAAAVAVSRRQPGQVVRPSDVAAVRANSF